MDEYTVPSKLYRVYWTGRYLERLDSMARMLLSILGADNPGDRAVCLASLAVNLGIPFKGEEEFLCRMIYDEETPSSVLHAARMVRINFHGIGIERVLREANMLVLVAEDRVDCRDLDTVKKHLQDVLTAAGRLGKIIEEELVITPTPPEHVLREQLLHQQQ